MAIDQPIDEEGIAIVVDQKSMGVDECYDPDSEINHDPLNIVRPESMGSEIKKRPGRRVKEIRQRTKTYKRKRSWPAVSKSAKSNNDVNFVPTVPNADGRKKYTRVQGICGLAFKRASEVQEKFPGEYPIFTRCMVPSNVLRVFWLHISSNFCRRYLPKQDAIMTLEDEEGQRDYANYLSGSYGLSGGWRNFAKEHCLKVGDTVVFQLVMPKFFKVYIRRENESTTTDDDVRSKEDPGVTTSDSSLAPGGDAGNQASEEVDDVDGMRSPDPGTEDSDGVPSFKNFNIFIDGLVINPELFPNCLRRTYYELCHDQKALLHRHLPTKINHTLIMGVITETTKIAEGISAASSCEDLAAWKKILQSFELLGMDVGFLCKRVDDLLGLLTARSSTDLQPTVEHKAYEEVKLEKDHAPEKMRALKSRMSTLKDALNAMDVEVEEMELSAKKIAQAMRQMANAP